MKKSIFLFFAAILCAIGMNAATPTKIYLNAQDWGYGDARYAAYFFDPAMWVDMKKVDGETFIYEVDVPTGYTKVILCRMNGGTTENNWDNRWNQTGDLTIPTDGKNMFKPDDWNGQTTTWSVYTPSTPPVTHTFAKNSTLYIDFRAITDKKGANYPKAGSVGIDYSANAGGTVIPVTFTADVKWTEGVEFMKTEKGDWASIPFKAPEAGQNCAQVAADGKSYTWTTYSEPSVTLSLDKTEADAGTEVTVTLTATADNVSGEVTYAFQYSTDNATWNNITATGNTATQTFAAETRYYKVTMTNGGTIKEATAKFSAIKFHVIGSWDDWTAHNEVVEGSKTITLEADTTYEYKITNGTWDYSWGNDGTMERGNCTDWSFESNNNAKIKTDEAGDYVFNVSRNAEGKVKVSVTYPAPTPTYIVTVSAENGSVGGLENEGVYEKGASVTLTATAAEGYEFVNWTIAGEEVSTENPYTFVVSADVALVANFKKAVEEYTITLSGLLKYTNDWRGYTTLQNEEGDTAFFVYNYVDGVPAYGEDYTVTANLGELTLEGTGSWKLIDELETITAVLYNEERTAVYNVTVSAKAPEVHNLACTDALYVENISEWMSELIITGVIDEDALTISVYDWKEATAGTYYQVTGVLNDEVYIQPESAVVTIVDTKLTIVFSAKDELGNTYNVNVTATPKPNTPLVVENATFTVDGDNLTIQGQWETKSVVVALVGWSTTKYGEYNNAVLMTGTGDADDDIYAEFSAVLSKDGTTATLTGVAANWDGTKYDVTISGLAPAETPTALDNVDTTVAPAKVINNGQLIIIRNGVQYNAQGAVVK